MPVSNETWNWSSQRVHWQSLSNQELAQEVLKLNVPLTKKLRKMIRGRIAKELQLSNPNEQVVHDFMLCLV